MFDRFLNFFGLGEAPSNSSSESTTTPTEDTLSSGISSFFGGSSEPRGPTSVIVVYGTHEISHEFSDIDFEAEVNPKDGITVDNLKWTISRLLTPYIMDSKKPGSASANKGILNINNFTITCNGRKLEEPNKSLKSYGVKTGDKIMVNVSNVAATAAAAAAASRVQASSRGGKGGKGKKGGKKKGGSGKGQNQSQNGPDLSFDKPILGGGNRDTTNISSIPRSFPKKPLTAREKIEKVLEEIEKDIAPLISKFVGHIPEDKQQRDDEHRLISETLLQKMLVLDGIDTTQEEEGEHEVPLRQKRKEAVNEVHKHLSTADAALKAAKAEDTKAEEN